MRHLVQHHNSHNLDDIGHQIAVPDEVWQELRDEPKHRDDRQRQGKRDKQRHAVIAIQFIDNHDGVDVAEGDKADGEDA